MSGGQTTIDVSGNIAQAYNNMFNYYLGASYVNGKSVGSLGDLTLAMLQAYPYNIYQSQILDPTGYYEGGGGMYSIFALYMLNFNISNLYSQIMVAVVNQSYAANIIAAEQAYLDDNLYMNSLPRVNTGARDMGATNSTGYLYAKAMLEDTNIKAITKFSADLYQKLMDIGERQWEKTLDWNTQIVDKALAILQAFLKDEYAYLDKKVDLAVKNVLWPMIVLDYFRAMVGAISGGQPVGHQSALSNAGSAITAGIGAAGLFAGGGTSGTASAAASALPEMTSSLSSLLPLLAAP